MSGLLSCSVGSVGILLRYLLGVGGSVFLTVCAVVGEGRTLADQFYRSGAQFRFTFLGASFFFWVFPLYFLRRGQLRPPLLQLALSPSRAAASWSWRAFRDMMRGDKTSMGNCLVSKAGRGSPTGPQRRKARRRWR